MDYEGRDITALISGITLELARLESMAGVTAPVNGPTSFLIERYAVESHPTMRRRSLWGNRYLMGARTAMPVRDTMETTASISENSDVRYHG